MADQVAALQASGKPWLSLRRPSKESIVMTRHHSACVLGLLGLLMVMGAREARAQQIDAPVCYMLGPAQYWLTVMHLTPTVSPHAIVIGGYRVVNLSGGQAVEPLSGGGVVVFDQQGNYTHWYELHEAITGGGTTNPAATTLIVITRLNGQASLTYTRTEYGSGTQLIVAQGTTQGTLTPCP
jgi:hypothetical protein